MRKTKIIVTIGPSSREHETLDQLITNGMDCARLNFSHGTHAEHAEVIKSIRQLSQKHGKPVAVLQDLGGIKLRLGKMDKPVQLDSGDIVAMTSDSESHEPDVLPFPQPRIFKNLVQGNHIFIADGSVLLDVIEVTDTRAYMRVLTSGVVSSYRGVNLPGVAIDAPVFTEKDEVDLLFGVEQNVDWVAISFVRTAKDILYAREKLDAVGSKAFLMAKLERGEGIDNIDSILPEVEAVMVARGDLGVEIAMEKVPKVQKAIVREANDAGKVSVIATQILRSMVVSPTPTRAEISDISNAVLDGCDAILLSDETAMGNYPVEALRIAAATIDESEEIYPFYKELASRDRTQAITSAAARLVRSIGSKPVVITSTGRAVLELARYRPDSDILAFSHDPAVLQKLSLGWGIQPAGVIPPQQDMAALVASVIQAALDAGAISNIDVVPIVHGFLPGVSGTTNAVQVLDMREYLEHSDYHRGTESAGSKAVGAKK